MFTLDTCQFMYIKCIPTRSLHLGFFNPMWWMLIPTLLAAAGFISGRVGSGSSYRSEELFLCTKEAPAARPSP